jgi:AhpD family alkylhydroperoxidase
MCTPWVTAPHRGLTPPRSTVASWARLGGAQGSLHPPEGGAHAGRQWYQDVLTLSGHLARGPLDAAIYQLVEVRVSQITGCAYSLSLHSDGARKASVDQAKLDMLAGWRKATGFDEREHAALDLAEAMTRLGDGKRVDELVWSAGREQFSDEELAALLYLVGLINVWNRINVAVELPSDHELPKRRVPVATD